MKKGNLYLIPSFLAESNHKHLLSQYNLDLIYTIDVFIVENLRTARRFLRKLDYLSSFEEVTFFELNKRTDQSQLHEFLLPCFEGKHVGLLSEAGSPCIADPGADVVKIAHQQKIKVVPLTGPSSILLALIASGFNGQNFAFNGYLPIDNKDREKKIKELEIRVGNQRQTQIFMETPYRNNAMLGSLLKCCKGDTLLCIAVEITHESLEEIRTQSIADWKKNKPDLHKKTCVFLIYS